MSVEFSEGDSVLLVVVDPIDKTGHSSNPPIPPVVIFCPSVVFCPSVAFKLPVVDPTIPPTEIMNPNLLLRYLQFADQLRLLLWN